MSKADISTTPILARRHCCSDRIHSNPDARRRHLYAAHLILETGGDAKETMGWIELSWARSLMRPPKGLLKTARTGRI